LSARKATPGIDVQSNSAAVAAQTAMDLNLIQDEEVWITTRRRGTGMGAVADGGTIPGARQPYGDKAFYMLAPGEEVISNRYGQADRHRDLLKAINAGGLADGGTVRAALARVSAPNVNVSPSMSLAGASFVLEVPGMGQLTTRVVRAEMASDRRFQGRLDDRD
jgi:hypothetical protein